MRLFATLILHFIGQLREHGRERIWWLVRTFLVINGIFAVAAFVYIKQPYRLFYNNTWSMPKGLWVRHVDDHGPYQRGDTVQVRYEAPEWIRQRTWYDALHTTIIKDIGAVAGDHLKVDGSRIYVCPPKEQCHFLARRLGTDGSQAPMHHVPLPEVVPPHQYFLVGENPRSLDSRYLGLFGLNAVIGHVRPLWTRDIPAEAMELTEFQRWAEDENQLATQLDLPEPPKPLQDK